jgi:benzoyl-CoA reductase/2-hydroxyglutaryl-CoA dehydratase subunit BcrC/BadD/HgdB
MRRIGITTTIPQEIIWAAGDIPVDLNNVLIESKRRDDFLARARRDGYPRTICPWIAGIYGAIVEERSIDALVVVTQGDCSNTHALAETIEDAGIEVIPFAFPYDGNKILLEAEMLHLAERLGTSWSKILEWHKRLEDARRLAWRIDELTWLDNKITGFENHLWLVTTSDFNGDFEKYISDARDLIDTAELRKPFEEDVRLGYIGVPPIFPEIFDEFEGMGARVVFNETQRQFSLPYPDDGIVDAFAKYTYPASVFRRIEDIKSEIERRSIGGIVHYTQSFCFRQIEDLLFRKYLGVPVLTVEGENDFEMDERTRVRMEAFVKMLEHK